MRPSLIYRSEIWTIYEEYKPQINAMKMEFLRRIKNKTNRDKKRNEISREKSLIRILRPSASYARLI